MQAALDWWRVANAHDVPSPALLVFPDRIEENIRRMTRVAGGVERLWPHVKTHKMAEVVRMQMAHGIRHFKAATIAETEMVASCGASDVVLAYQPVGPNATRLLELVRRFPQTRFAAVVDDAGVIRDLSDVFQAAKRSLDVLLDIDCGMHRTGIAPGEDAAALYAALARAAGLQASGLHAYDGHIHDPDLATRTAQCEAAFHPVRTLRTQLEAAGQTVPRLLAGGTPTFPFLARQPGVDCSPGTCLLWDAGYSSKYPDLDFLPAALVLTRVVSKPGTNRLCLDLGHKAIAAENPHPRVQLLGVPDVKPVMHSEEHLVVETPVASKYSVGDCLYGMPWHICPTVALHSEAVVVKKGSAQERWKITARDRKLTV